MRRLITMARRHDPKDGTVDPVIEEQNPDEGKVSDVDDGGESAAAGSLDS
jgi:hypothetical protein